VVLRRGSKRKRGCSPPPAKETVQPRGKRLRVVTYNVHKCRGLDGRVRPERIAAVLQELDADIVALQEVLSIEGASREDNQAKFLAEELGLDYRIGETRRLKGGAYGNIVLSRLPMLCAQQYDISHRRREERGCLRIDIAVGPMVLHVYNVHLGTAYMERRHQGRKLLHAEILNREDITGPRILLGDFNEWIRGLTSRSLTEHFGTVDARVHLKRKRTYPGLLPLLRLDHIYFDPPLILEDANLYRTRLTVVASDHLPLVADFLIPEAPA
jgi:endonuclease/exonuclease/phosphatase family metal-dependent hydrolase